MKNRPIKQRDHLIQKSFAREVSTFTRTVESKKLYSRSVMRQQTRSLYE